MVIFMHFFMLYLQFLDFYGLQGGIWGKEDDKGNASSTKQIPNIQPLIYYIAKKEQKIMKPLATLSPHNVPNPISIIKFKHNINFLLLTILLLFLIPKTQQFNLEILQPDVLQPMIFVSGKLSDYYNASVYEQHFVCTNGELEIIEFEESPAQELIVFRYSGAELRRQDINITVQPNTQPTPFISDFNRIYKKFTLNAGCPQTITKQNYYNRIKISLSIHQQQPKRRISSKYQRKTTPEIYQFSFLLNCDLWDVHKHFQYGYIFISIICITIVVFVSLHPRICSLVVNKKPMNFQIKWQYFLMITLLMLGILGFIYSKKNVYKPDIKTYFGNRTENQNRFKLANAFLKHLGLLSSLFYVYVCCSQLFFQWGWLISPLPISNLKIRGQRISKRAIVSGFISIICYIIGLWYQNWIYYNILSFCIAIGAIKMFRFRSLKNGVYTMLIVLASIIMFTIWSYLKLPRAVNDYASELSSPLFVEVPDLVNNLYKKCSWISIYDMILPGAVLAYLRDYDENYHIGWKGVYTFASIFIFTLSCVAWVVIQALIQYNIPFCIVIYPPFIFCILLLALYRNQFETIWNGYFHFSLDHSINQIIQQYNTQPNPDENMPHLFPKDVLDAIKYEQSRWSDSESMHVASHRRALDDSEIEVWSATLGKRDSVSNNASSLTVPKQEKSSKNLFISQNILPKQKDNDDEEVHGNNSAKTLISSESRYIDLLRRKGE